MRMPKCTVFKEKGLHPMKKRFNIAGTCIPQKHYMADTSDKISRIVRLIEQESYFTINRARQYGKTTTLMLLWSLLKERYVVINISFEGMGMDAFGSEDAFVRRFCRRVEKNLRLSGYGEEKRKIWECAEGKEDLETLRDRITDFCGQEEEVLLFIDEVDKSSDNQMFLNFLGLLRELYLERAMGTVTFKSVILAGVYDVKNLKLKFRPDEEKKYNSPWNIAVDFPIDMSLSVPEISAMVREYEEGQEFSIEAEAVAEEIHRYTSGYPFLVSLICLWMDERISVEIALKDCWTPWGVRAAVREILKGTNVLFDDMIKNLENHPKFRSFVEGILFGGNQVPYKVSNPEINLGVTFGIIGENEGLCKISNIMFETYIYDHFIADQVIGKQVLSSARTQFVDENGDLEMDTVLEKFQDLMKAEYRREDEAFFERQGRLLFLCFLKPIINGTGHYVVEPQTRSNTRMDIVVFYGKQEYIVELKLWSGPRNHGEGVEQLMGYMESRGQKKGWLLTFCFLKNREKRMEEYTRTMEYAGEKSVYSVVV